MNAIVCYCKPERKSERERNERISSISILLWCWLHFVRNGALMEDKRPVFMTCSPCAPRSPLGRDCHLWAGAQSHISAFITLFFSLSQPHTHKPSRAACSARVRHRRYAVDINLHSYTDIALVSTLTAGCIHKETSLKTKRILTEDGEYTANYILVQ